MEINQIKEQIKRHEVRVKTLTDLGLIQLAMYWQQELSRFRKLLKKTNNAETI